jgi:hypothetical protein
MHFDRLKRRDFITLLGGTTMSWPFAVRAQQAPKLPTTGFGFGHTGNREPTDGRFALSYGCHSDWVRAAVMPVDKIMRMEHLDDYLG